MVLQQFCCTGVMKNYLTSFGSSRVRNSESLGSRIPNLGSRLLRRGQKDDRSGPIFKAEPDSEREARKVWGPPPQTPAVSAGPRSPARQGGLQSRRDPPTAMRWLLCPLCTAAMYGCVQPDLIRSRSRSHRNSERPPCFKTRRPPLNRGGSADRVPTQSAEDTASGGGTADQGPAPSPPLHRLRRRLFRRINQTNKKDPAADTVLKTAAFEVRRVAHTHDYEGL